MSNKRIRIKKAKAKKKLILRDQALETANLIIKLHTAKTSHEQVIIGLALQEKRMHYINQIRAVNEVIKYGKQQLKGCRIVKLSEQSMV